MPDTTIETDLRPTNFAQGRVSTQTLARWSMVRQIAELEDALEDSYHRADHEAVYAWAERARAVLARKREELRRL
ncbi:MAG: hypothetical protein HYX63_02830 [Gammaproteobacteria bacterium]|nr:hypothetical protein [Gammaproteobacteria bacterium]